MKRLAEHFETWLHMASAGQFDDQGDHHTPPAYVGLAFRKYLECGIFAHGFARVRCDDCGDDFLAPACGPPLWEGEGAQEPGEGVEAEPDWDLANQSPPDYPDAQRTDWRT